MTALGLAQTSASSARQAVQNASAIRCGKHGQRIGDDPAGKMGQRLGKVPIAEGGQQGAERGGTMGRDSGAKCAQEGVVGTGVAKQHEILLGHAAAEASHALR